MGISCWILILGEWRSITVKRADTGRFSPIRTVIRSAKFASVTKIVLYDPSQITDYQSDIRIPLPCQTSDPILDVEKEPLGTAGALFRMYAAGMIQEDFFLINGDIMLDIDFTFLPFSLSAPLSS